MAPRSPRAPFAIAVTTFAVGACAGPRSELVFDTTVSLSGARFAGPITVDICTTISDIESVDFCEDQSTYTLTNN